jgi:hypothetical protein
MAAGDFAVAADVAAVWRPLTAAETEVAGTLVTYASALLRSLVPNIDQRITDGDLDGALARLAVVQMVKRVLINPEGVRSESETTGPFSESKTWDVGRAVGRLSVTAEDLALVAGRAAGPRVRSIRLQPGLR